MSIEQELKKNTEALNRLAAAVEKIAGAKESTGGMSYVPEDKDGDFVVGRGFVNGPHAATSTTADTPKEEAPKEEAPKEEKKWGFDAVAEVFKKLNSLANDRSAARKILTEKELPSLADTPKDRLQEVAEEALKRIEALEAAKAEPDV